VLRQEILPPSGADSPVLSAEVQLLRAFDLRDAANVLALGLHLAGAMGLLGGSAAVLLIALLLSGRAAVPSQARGDTSLPPGGRSQPPLRLRVGRLQRRLQRAGPLFAETLGVSIHTVTRHLENIFAKMGVGSRTQAVVEAVQAGLVTPGPPAA
jgi:hypothetical protein